MRTDTEGIVLRQIKTAYDRRMIHLFSKKYGKISVGANIAEKSKSKSSLAVKPFTYAKYDLFKGVNSYNLNNASVLKSYYKIGEDVDKYMYSSYILELTAKMLPDEQPSQGMFNLLLDYLEVIENRKKSPETIVLGYMVRTLKIMGCLPELNYCTRCGKPITAENQPSMLDIKEGGIICRSCTTSVGNIGPNQLRFSVNSSMISVLKYYSEHSLKDLQWVALDESVYKRLHVIIKKYIAYHLDITDLKSEGMLA